MRGERGVLRRRMTVPRGIAEEAERSEEIRRSAEHCRGGGILEGN
jgi:hypothetical protein